MNDYINKNFLKKRYISYINIKKELLYHPKIVEYLYSNPLINEKDSNFTNKISINKNIKINDKYILQIESLFIILHELFKKYFNKNMINIIPELTEPAIKINNILKKYQTKYKYNYVHQWSFYIDNIDLKSNKKFEILYKNNYIFNFFGIITKKNILKLFIIHYDDKKLSYEDNILLEKIIIYMNIFFLKINDKQNFENEIIFFFNNLIFSNNFNNDLSKEKLFFNKNIINLIKNYNYNHIIYLKYYQKNFNDEKNIIKTYNNKNQDDFFFVNSNSIKNIINNKKKLLEPIEIKNNTNIINEKNYIQSLIQNCVLKEKNNFKIYLNLERLKNFNLLKDLNVLNFGKTYIKYILKSDAFKNKNYNEHIHVGGIFISGGFYEKNIYQKIEDINYWTHLLLKRIPYQLKKNNIFHKHFYYINIKKYHIFYKYFN